jgi:hypothetical protein
MGMPVYESVYKMASFALLQYWRAKEERHWEGMISNASAKKDRLEVLQWLQAQVPPCPWNKDGCSFTAREGPSGGVAVATSQAPPPSCPWNILAC